jgi:hypothetical protein
MSAREDARAALDLQEKIEAWEPGRLEQTKKLAGNSRRLARALRALLDEPVPAVEREASRALEYKLARHRVGPGRANVRSAEDVALAAAITAGFRRQGPITDAMVEAAAEAFGGITSAKWEDASDWEREEVRDGMLRALEAAEAAR